MKCEICSNSNKNEVMTGKEMMFGLRHQFDYFRCSNCGCIQIKDIPDNISQYYPHDYYSYSSKENSNKDHWIIKYLKRERLKYSVFNSSLIGKVLFHIDNEKKLRALSKINVNKSMSVLDIGCGNGEELLRLQKIGFRKLTGIDPYIENDIFYDCGVKIYKKELLKLDEKFDVIMMHHSFEHMVNPKEIFKKAKQLLNKNGYIIIRIPVSDTFAFNHYGTSWVAFDAPRHFFLHTTKSIKYLCKLHKLSLTDVVYDSTDFQFWGSEQHQNNIATFSENSYAVNPKKSIFKRNDIISFKKKANRLNRIKEGDQAIFYISKELE